MPSHLQDFAHDMVAGHGPRTAGMIWHAFTNVGNIVAGASQAEQIATVEAELRKDDRLGYDETNPGRGGGWFSHKEDHDDAGDK
ncbi:hypothetical protein AB9E14_23680 [Rhizobium leguminosarum]|uniref:hypothetical protein n=1 Tax=Rhizobium leguminosarum TaxID=384 RepID=UPI003F9ABF66